MSFKYNRYQTAALAARAKRGKAQATLNRQDRRQRPPRPPDARPSLLNPPAPPEPAAGPEPAPGRDQDGDNAGAHRSDVTIPKWFDNPGGLQARDLNVENTKEQSRISMATAFSAPFIYEFRIAHQ